jgi:hypothetical protein
VDEAVEKQPITTTAFQDVYAFIFGAHGLVGMGVEGSKISRFEPET